VSNKPPAPGRQAYPKGSKPKPAGPAPTTTTPPRKQETRKPGKLGRRPETLPAGTPTRKPKPGQRPPIQPRVANTGDIARDAAAAHLALSAEAYPNLDLRDLILPTGLDRRDAALAHAIVDAATKRWVTLERLIAKGCRQPTTKLQPTVRGALLAGAAQIVLLERVPAHAALNHAVEWTKRSLGSGAGGLVNAVLRRVAEFVGPRVPMPEDWWLSRRHIPLPDGRALQLSADVLPEEEVHLLAASTGVPRAVLLVWANSLGVPEARRLALPTVQIPPAIINTEADKNPKADHQTRPHDVPGHLVWQGEPGALATWLSAHPRCWVQDPASAHVVRFLKKTITTAPKTIADLCAGQGTKTRQLAHHFPAAQVIATDIDTARRATLAQTFEPKPGTSESPQPHAGVRAVEHAALAAYAGWADLVLLDVPCSNTGVLARRPEAKYRFGDHTLGQLMAVQRDILTQGRATLKGPGALLAYSTCSLDERENRHACDWACAKLSLELVADERTLPQGTPPDGPQSYTDGSYVALLRAK